MSEVKPALTPEEWAALSVPAIDDYNKDQNIVAVRGKSLMVGMFGKGGNVDAADLNDEGRHAAAALALHEQPFGFTRADVQMCHALAENWTIDFREMQAMMASLRDRIAALLPPAS